MNITNFLWFQIIIIYLRTFLKLGIIKFYFQKLKVFSRITVKISSYNRNSFMEVLFYGHNTKLIVFGLRRIKMLSSKYSIIFLSIFSLLLKNTSCM